MPRKKKLEEKEKKIDAISGETKKSVAAVLLLGFALILILASFNKAGPIGEMLYQGLDNLVGWGYYLLPIIALAIALVFLIAQEKRFLSPTFIGASILIISSLSFIDIVFPEKAGLLGNILGLIEEPFGFVAGLVVVAVLILASALITLNVPLRIDKLIKKKKDEDDLDIKEGGVSIDEKEISKEKDIKIKETLGKFIPKEKEVKKDFAAILAAANKNYKFPPISLLKTTIERPTAGDLRANANIIKRTLESFGIPVDMGEISIGPKVTRYTLKPAEGIKLTRIIALNQDLSLALAAHPLRIEAPIPGKSLVGIEVPNKVAAIVRLGSLMSYPEFTKTGPLEVVLGRDVDGEPISANIEKMPHLLVSGSTGSGKSIVIHSLITSLLYKNSPETLRFIFIDPKRVELSVYQNIPHLVSPVIVEGKKAINVFRWAINEMEQRYEILLKAGARDITSHNKKGGEVMPYIVIVVDELADLMAAHGREIEASIVRLAQMARATGIHLVLATQRPSVEVITGLIKANIPARIALKVASQIDSRTILDAAGAEKLLGGGDMLFISSEYSKPKRIQGSFLSEGEIKRVADFVRKNNEVSEEEGDEAEKAEEFSQKKPPIDFESFAPEEQPDDLFNEAVEVVRQAQKASASLLQRRLKVGYARAARLLDIMEEKSLIGPGDGAKAREVYIEGVQDDSATV